MPQYIRQVAYALVGSGYTMAEIPLLLLDKAFRDKVLKDVASTNTRLFWKSYDALRPTEQLDRSESTLDRIDSLLSNSIIRNIVGQTRTTIDFRAIMDKGKILLVSLSARYESLTSLLGSIIIGQLLTAALSRAGTNKRRQFNLYADEYQRFATPDFSTLLTEARKFGVATTIAHQVRSQLDEKNAATALQAGSLVCFRLTSEDAEELAAEFNLEPPRLPPTVPRNVLEYIDRHPNETVKKFAADYIHKLNEARKLRTREDKEFVHHPIYDFGEGDVVFEEQWVDDAYNAMQTLFYEQMTKGEVLESSLLRVMRRMARLLRFNKIGTGISPEQEEKEVARYKQFAGAISDMLHILDSEKIEATPTIIASQQNYSDRKNEIANKLTQLKRGQAMVKLPKGEHLMETIKNTTGFNDTPNKQQIIDNTRQKYCRPRSEVEEEIRNRHHFPPPTTRRGTVE